MVLPSQRGNLVFVAELRMTVGPTKQDKEMLSIVKQSDVEVNFKIPVI
jgi:hypothetical protein